MKVLLLEDNLMWSVRTVRGLETLGHTVALVSRSTGEYPDADLAIVNLSARAFDPYEAVAALKKKGIKTIGHIGHKEKEVWEKGEKAGCDKVVSNGSLAKRLEAVIDEATR
jgi:hypothetical protein